MQASGIHELAGKTGSTDVLSGASLAEKFVIVAKIEKSVTPETLDWNPKEGQIAPAAWIRR